MLVAAASAVRDVELDTIAGVGSWHSKAPARDRIDENAIDWRPYLVWTTVAGIQLYQAAVGRGSPDNVEALAIEGQSIVRDTPLLGRSGIAAVAVGLRAVGC